MLDPVKRKRRRYNFDDDFVVYNESTSEVDPWTSEMESRTPMDTEEEARNETIRNCTDEARRSHREMETTLNLVQRTLHDSAEVLEDAGRPTVPINNVLLELRTVIDKHIGALTTISPNREVITKKKPTIRNIERVDLDVSSVKRRDVTWAEVTKKKPRVSQVEGKPQLNRRGKVIASSSSKDIRVEPRRLRPADTDPMKSLDKKANKSAAISITTRGGIGLREIMSRAKQEIDLREIGIETCQTRSGFTGGIIIEIPGEEAERKADELASRLSNLYPNNEDIRISRPKVKADMKIVGLDESTSNEEIQAAIGAIGLCLPADIRINAIRRTNRGVGIAWLQCPVDAAIKIIQKKKIMVGWSVVTCFLLELGL